MPPEKAPLCAFALNGFLLRTASEPLMPTQGMNALLLGERTGGETRVKRPKVGLIGATGSPAMGHKVGLPAGLEDGRQ